MQNDAINLLTGKLDELTSEIERISNELDAVREEILELDIEGFMKVYPASARLYQSAFRLLKKIPSPECKSSMCD